METTEVIVKDEESYINEMIEKWLNAKDLLVVGKPILRIDSLEKALGVSKYVNDYLVAGTLYARLIKAPVSSGILKGINFKDAERVKGFVAGITHADIPGKNQVGYFIEDQPLFVDSIIHYHGEPLGLVVAETMSKADESRELVKVEYEERPGVYDPIKAMEQNAPLVHPERGSNIALKTKARKGDVNKGFEMADVVVEHEYRAGFQDHAYIEPEIVLVIPNGRRFQIIVSGQYPHLVQKMVSNVLGINQSDVNVIVPYVGGGFGGKDDIGPVIAAQAAVAAYKLNKPILLSYSREDSFTSHNKREAAIVKYKTGATKEGKLTAVEASIIFDSGAYANRGPFTLWRGTVHATGPYEIPNVKIDGYLVYTNKVYTGSFRGFGNPEPQMAAELNLNEIAEKLNIDPIDIRLINLLHKGSTTGTEHVITEDVGLKEALLRLKESKIWKEREKVKSSSTETKKRGIGIACAWHGMGTSRASPQYSAGYLVMRKDGSVDVYSGITEIGQGTSTGIAQIVAEVLGLPLELITINAGSSEAPDTGATHSSRGSNLGTMGVYVAAIKLRWKLINYASKVLDCNFDKIELREGYAVCKESGKKVSIRDLASKALENGYELASTGYYSFPRGKFDEEEGKGFMYVMFSYIALATDVEVDEETGKVRVLKVQPAIAAGRVLNPLLAKQQINGAFVQGMGYSLTEELVIQNGKIMNPTLADYLVPTTLDVLDTEFLDPIFVEDVSRYGPFGAKGIGEMALIPVPAALLSAIRTATGKLINEIPATPERIFKVLKGE